jgi:hypothetical protein
MAVTGQFGKIITGSGSLASSISGIASSYITLRLNRIYKAFVNKESFEGREITSAIAIELLNKMMATTTKGGKSRMDVEETLRAIRKASRTRTLNEIDTTLKEQSANGDYANKVRVIEEMLLDPTLNPDDIDELRDELNDAVDDLLTNTQNQFASGGKVTINGKTIDFAGGANQDVFLSLYDDAIGRNPEASEKYNKEKVIAEASVIVAKGNAAWLSKSRTTDSAKYQGYTEQLKFLQQAYDLLSSSKYGLATEAEKVLSSIRNLQENQSIANKNMAGAAADKRINAGYDNIFKDLDAIDEAMKAAPTIKDLLGETSFAQLLAGNQNAALSILDQFISVNGGSIKRPDGTKITLTIDNISDMMKDARSSAAALVKWAKNNPSVTDTTRKTIASWDRFATVLGKAAPILTVEDNYDDAVDDLGKAMDKAGADIGARAAALRAFGARLNTISGTSGIPSDIARSLQNESAMYITGRRPSDTSDLYGEYSGNILGGNNVRGIYDPQTILGGIISPGTSGEGTSIFDAITSVYDQETEWIAGNGTVITDIDGEDVPDTGTQDTSAWEKGQGVMIKTLGTITIAGKTTISSLVNQNLQRIRIVIPGGQADPTDIDKYTRGWVSRVKQSDGTFKYIVFSQNADTSNKLLTGSAAQQFVQQYLRNGNWNSLVDNVGGNRVITVPVTAGESLVKLGDGDSLDATDLSDGSVWGLLKDKGYTWASDYQGIVDGGIRKAVKDGLLTVRNGRVYIPDGKKIGGSQGEALIDLDITEMISPEMLTQITELFPTVDTTPGEGSGAGDGSTRPSSGNQRVGKDRWAGTQWAGQDASTVISKTAGGRDLTLGEAFSGGTGFMWDTGAKKTGGSVKPMTSGMNIPKATKDKMDSYLGRYDRARAASVAGTGMGNVVTGGINRAQSGQQSDRMLQTFMRNMPTAKGGTGGLPQTGVKYTPIARNRNV